MKKYIISVPQVWYQDKEIKANSLEEAKAAAFEDFMDLDREDGSEFIGNLPLDNEIYDYLVLEVKNEENNSCESPNSSPEPQEG